MYFWFQNLKKDDREEKWFHFRGSFGRAHDRVCWLKYSFASGPALSIRYQHGEAGDSGESSMLSLGLGFFTVYLTFFLPRSWYFQKKCIATWDGGKEFYLVEGRQYGFYFYEWAFVWAWHEKVMEHSSKDPWWMSQYIHLDDLLLGRPETLSDEITSNEDVYFKIGDKEFKMDSIKWKRMRRFRRFIPYFLYHHTWYSVDMEIKDPPMHAGKGENSWDCGDDGSYGLYCEWKGERPGWDNREVITKQAIQMYIENTMKTAKRYGGSDSARGVRASQPWEYVGRKPTPDELNQNGTEAVHA